jgi:hypothetical protein
MKKLLLLFAVSLTFIKTYAQTSPAPYDLSSGAYTFTHWDSAASINPALSYPSNMIFHTLGNQNPDENTVANGDWACTYDLQAGCRINGKDSLGAAFLNIGNSQTPNCIANGVGNTVYVGDATVALNTTNCENISVSWIGRMLSSFNFVNTPPNQVSRFYGIACQYRIGTTGTFTNVPGNYLFKCNLDSATYKAVGTADTLVALLPDTCNNQPVVEVRWIYHQLAQNAGGPRPTLAIDDINISRDVVTASTLVSSNKKALSVYPNPVGAGKINLNKATNFVVVDMLGQVITKPTFAKDFNTENLSRGIYFIKTSEGEIVKFIKQ